MDNRFDFKKIGKRMPYTVPEGIFDEMRENVLKETARSTATSRRRWPSVRTIVMTAAASIAAAIILPTAFKGPHTDSTAAGFDSVERAFANLSSEDQAYMLEIYSEDIFINQ